MAPAQPSGEVEAGSSASPGPLRPCRPWSPPAGAWSGRGISAPSTARGSDGPRHLYGQTAEPSKSRRSQLSLLQKHKAPRPESLRQCVWPGRV